MTTSPKEQMRYLQESAHRLQSQIALSQAVVKSQEQGFKASDLLRAGKVGRVGAGLMALGAVAAGAVGAVPLALVLGGAAAGILGGSSIADRTAKKSAAELEKNMAFLEKVKPVMQQINAAYREVRAEIKNVEQQGYVPSVEFKEHVARTQQGITQTLESQQRLEQELRASQGNGQSESSTRKPGSSPRLG